MNSIDYLDLLMSNQKKVKDEFKFINLKTNEQATIEDCYETIKKDLEILDFLIEKLYVASGLFELQVCPPNNPTIKKYHNAIETHDERFDKYYKRICELKYGNK